MSVLKLKRVPIPAPAPRTIDVSIGEPMLLAGPIEPLVLLDDDEQELAAFARRQALIEDMVRRAEPWLTRAQLTIAAIGMFAAAWSTSPAWLLWLP